MPPEVNTADLIKSIQQRILAGEDVPADEMRQALAAYRRSNLAAAQSEPKRAKAPTRSAEDLLGLLTASVQKQQ